MFPVTITIHNANDLASIMHVLGAAGVASTPAAVKTNDAALTVEGAKPPKPVKAAGPAPGQPTATAAVAAAAVQSTEPPAPPPSTAPAAAAPCAPEAPTYDDVAKAITAAVKVNREQAVAALARFGAKRGPDLAPAQYAAFLETLAVPA